MAILKRIKKSFKEGLRGLKEIAARESKKTAIEKAQGQMPQVFEVGEGLTSSQKKSAEQTVTKKVIPVGPEPDFGFKSLVQMGEFLTSKDPEKQRLARQQTEQGVLALIEPEARVAKVASEMFKAPKIQNGAVYSVKKVFRKLFNNEALAKYGDEGKQIFSKIQSAEKQAVLNKSKAIVEIDNTFKNLSEEDFAKFGDYVEGKLPVSEQAKPALDAWKKIASDVASKARETGMKIKLPDGTKIDFKPREDYYPYFVKEEKLKEILQDQTKYTAFLEQVAEKSKITVAKAHELISEMINGRADIYGHLERARLAKLPQEFYERDPRKILSQYISDAYDRVADAREFGGDDSVLQGLIEKARQKGEDFEEIQDLVNRALGREKYNNALTQVSQFARNYNNFTKLSLAAITNLGDLTKIFTRNQLFPTLKGIVQAFTKEGKQFASEAGVIGPMLKRFASEEGGKFTEKFFKYTGFQATEQKLRQISANAGKNYVEMLFKKLQKNPANIFLKRRLEQFGLDAKELLQRGLKPQDLVEAGYQAIADTQPISRVDLPHYWQSPTGKLLTQYKTFAYKQMGFMKKFVFDEAKKGNVRPLLTFLVVGTALGEGVGDLKAYVRGKRKRSDQLGERIVDNLMTIGGIGLATDFLGNLKYNSMGGGLLKFVVGPTLSDIDAWLTAIQGDVDVLRSEKKKFQEVGKKSAPNKSQPKVLKKTIYSLPFIGPATANSLFPTKSTYKAKTIPLSEEILDLLDRSD